MFRSRLNIGELREIHSRHQIHRSEESCPRSMCVRDSGMDVTRANISEAMVKPDTETSSFMDQISL